MRNASSRFVSPPSVLLLDYMEADVTHVAYVVPIVGSADLAEGGLSVVAVPHAIYRRRLDGRPLRMREITQAAFVRARAAEYLTFDSIGDEAD